MNKKQTGLGNDDATHQPCFRRRVGDTVGDAPLDVHLEVLKTRQALRDVPRGEAPPGVAREHDRVHALQHRERVGLEECVELELDAPRGAPDGEVHIRDELVEVDVGRVDGRREGGGPGAAGVEAEGAEVGGPFWVLLL